MLRRRLAQAICKINLHAALREYLLYLYLFEQNRYLMFTLFEKICKEIRNKYKMFSERIRDICKSYRVFFMLQSCNLN